MKPIAWYTIPLDEDGPISRYAPACGDGDEVLCRVDGEAILCTVRRQHGVHFDGPDGEPVTPDAIATPPRRETRTEADMAARYDTIKLRLPLGYKARLLRLAEEDGYSASEWVRTWVEMAESEIAEIRQRPPKRSTR